MSVPVAASEQWQRTKPKLVFQLPAEAEYAPSQDGRFLITAPEGPVVSPIKSIVNWRPEKLLSQ
jgi:hypothetical protein